MRSELTKPTEKIDMAPESWWIHWLAPKTVLNEKSEALLDEWLEHEKSVCHNIIKKAAILAAMTAPLFYFLDSKRVGFDTVFSGWHRGVMFGSCVTLVIALQLKLLDRFRFAYVGYKLFFLLSGAVLCSFQMALMFRNPDVPRAYAPSLMVLVIAASGIGPMNSLVVCFVHSLILVFFGIIAHTSGNGWSTVISDVSLQVMAIVLVVLWSSRYTLQSKLFVAGWRERKRMTDELDSKQTWGQHAFDQLTKLVFPHVVERIHGGADIEDTMPLGVENAYTIGFDIVGSSKIVHEKFFDAVEKTFIDCWNIMMENYQISPLEANAYRVKEMGDGFLCSVGYPFRTPNNATGAVVAVEIADRFIEAFRKHMDALDYVEPIHCGIGIAYGTIEGYFPKGGVKQYDLRGRSIVMATRYEALRKQLPKRLVGKSDIMILSETVYCNLPSDMREKFQTLNLPSLNIKIRDDIEAVKAYYKTLNQTSVDPQVDQPTKARLRAA